MCTGPKDPSPALGVIPARRGGLAGEYWVYWHFQQEAKAGRLNVNKQNAFSIDTLMVNSPSVAPPVFKHGVLNLVPFDVAAKWDEEDQMQLERLDDLKIATPTSEKRQQQPSETVNPNASRPRKALPTSRPNHSMTLQSSDILSKTPDDENGRVKRQKTEDTGVPQFRGGLPSLQRIAQQQNTQGQRGQPSQSQGITQNGKALRQNVRPSIEQDHASYRASGKKRSHRRRREERE